MTETDEDEENIFEEDENDNEVRSEVADDDDINEAEIEIMRKELIAEISELEWEFRKAKEQLFNERISQVDTKLEQAKNATAPEFIDVATLVEEAYRIRRQVAKHRRDFAKEVIAKERDIQLLGARCDANDKLTAAEDRIRSRLYEKLIECKVEKSMRSLHSKRSKRGRDNSMDRKLRLNKKRKMALQLVENDDTKQEDLSDVSCSSRLSFNSSSFEDDQGKFIGEDVSSSSSLVSSDEDFDSSRTDRHMKGKNREDAKRLTKLRRMMRRRRRAGEVRLMRKMCDDRQKAGYYRWPVDRKLPGIDLPVKSCSQNQQHKISLLPEGAPCIVYQISESAIQADLAFLNNALREQKLARNIESMRRNRHL